jgi:hypothetical protein
MREFHQLYYPKATDMLENTIRNRLTLDERIITTLRIVEERGYNLTLKTLSENLIGGKVEQEKLEDYVKQMEDVEFDGFFVATSGHLKAKKCQDRIVTNMRLQKRYHSIVEEFLSDFLKMCPWVHCVLIAGSMASEGLSKGDDIDLDVIVEDGTKYSTWLLGLFLCFRYSLRYKREFSVRWYNSLARVICLSVIWEAHQTNPFQRRDGQLAYELLTARVLYNKDYFRRLVQGNIWLKSWFPQLLQKYSGDDCWSDRPNKEDKKKIPFFIEGLCHLGIIFLYYIIRSSIFWHDSLRDRMDYVNKVKRPYAILDNPKKITDRYPKDE